MPDKKDVMQVSEMDVEGLGTLRTGDEVKHPAFGKGLLRKAMSGLPAKGRSEFSLTNTAPRHWFQSIRPAARLV